ncbi:unnamed protein product [Arabidopsis lyrata]|uniref:protein HAIKU1 n=1 Tax=Arabidopsis lyrata subsp. lyrata TaxID=81972 RepID=UPI000A29A475|nr:protein HAIKU1 [Arabidopsis lyrata subsp. lyrata]CAH8254320.1 unnamed protein product [Arabidopsis lyrata]|eukprot:XP_020866840.1 protein HAIKU1 [Arabidopsis lyrata subsp. lyrata]
MDRPCWHNDQLGVNKIGKNIKKSPLHQPNFSIGIDPLMLQPQPQGYNISKNGFRSIVQQLTGSRSHESLPQPQQNTRLQKIGPVAQIQINRPCVPPPVMAQPTHELVARPPMHPLPHGSQSIMGHGDQFGSNTAESSASAFMCYRQSSLGDSGPNGNQMQPTDEYQQQPQVQGQAQPHPLLQLHNHHSLRFNGSARDTPILPTPKFDSPPQQMYNSSLPSPRFNGRGILPTPTSQYLVQSPTTYQNLLSPRPPYSLLSAGVQYPPPLTPRSYTFSSMSQPGILGPGTIPLPPASPFGVLPISSPRWRGY